MSMHLSSSRCAHVTSCDCLQHSTRVAAAPYLRHIVHVLCLPVDTPNISICLKTDKLLALLICGRLKPPCAVLLDCCCRYPSGHGTQALSCLQAAAAATRQHKPQVRQQSQMLPACLVRSGQQQQLLSWCCPSALHICTGCAQHTCGYPAGRGRGGQKADSTRPGWWGAVFFNPAGYPVNFEAYREIPVQFIEAEWGHPVDLARFLLQIGGFTGLTRRKLLETP